MGYLFKLRKVAFKFPFLCVWDWYASQAERLAALTSFTAASSNASRSASLANPSLSIHSAF